MWIQDQKIGELTSNAGTMAAAVLTTVNAIYLEQNVSNDQ
jgi:hypothetical protein